MKNFKPLWRAVAIGVLAVVGLVIFSGVSAVSAQTEEKATLTIVAPALNVRGGPDITHSKLDFLLEGDAVSVVSYDAARDWWQVRLPDGTIGWVSGGDEYVAVSDAEFAVEAAPIVTGSQSTIVFQATSGGPIYAINPDGTNLRYLTTGLDPVISPDGQQVAFARWETSQDGALGSLWIINIDGSGERVVSNNIYNPRTPTWSADGTQLIISMQYGGRIGEERRCGGSRPPRGAYDIDVGREPDGDIEICYTLPPDPHWGLRTVDVLTGQHQDLPNQTYSFSPAWDPLNPARVVYDGDRGLVNLNLDTLVSWPLTTDVNDRSPSFSPDGRKIAVSYRQDNHWEVQVMNTDGSGRVRLTQTSYRTLAEQILNGETPKSFNNAAPAWSPDGTELIFLTDRAGSWEIWIMGADGSNQRPLVTAAMLAGIPLQYNGVDEQMLSWR